VDLTTRANSSNHPSRPFFRKYGSFPDHSGWNFATLLNNQAIPDYVVSQL
jgi:hypothetical protein